MTNQLKTLLAASFLSVGALVGFGSGEAEASCGGAKHSSCETAVDQQYRGGGHNPTTVPFQACLDNNMFNSIKLRDGRSFFEAGFYYGSGKPEVVRTVHNSNCWSTSDRGRQQTGAPGAFVVAFIDCDYYTGWVGGQIPRAGGQFVLRPMSLPAAHDPCLNGKCGRGR